MKPFGFAGLCALGLLLFFCGASICLESALGTDGTVHPEIAAPDSVAADETFYVTLCVTNKTVVWPYAPGNLSVDGVWFQDFSITFDTESYWKSDRILLGPLSAGLHTLNFSVYYWLNHEWTGIQQKATVNRSVDVLPVYSVVWLLRPDEPIRVGKMIRLRFSIRDAGGLFVRNDSVRIVIYDNPDMSGTPVKEATCGRERCSIRVNTGKGYYRWYWKSDLPDGDYYVFVLLEDVKLNYNSFKITMVP